MLCESSSEGCIAPGHFQWPKKLVFNLLEADVDDKYALPKLCIATCARGHGLEKVHSILTGCVAPSRPASFSNILSAKVQYHVPLPFLTTVQVTTAKMEEVQGFMHA